MWRNSALAGLALLAGCDNLASGNRSQRAGEVKVRDLAENAVESAAPVGVGAPMAWQVAGGAAAFGAAGSAPVLTLRCEREAGTLVIERPGGGTAITIAAGDVEQTLGTRPGQGDRVQARVPIDDALVAQMAAPQAQLMLVDAAGERRALPGGVAVRRVVEACRTPEAPVVGPADNAAAPADGELPVPPPAPAEPRPSF
jgi:hypothetical protein